VKLAYARPVGFTHSFTPPSKSKAALATGCDTAGCQNSVRLTPRLVDRPTPARRRIAVRRSSPRNVETTYRGHGPEIDVALPPNRDGVDSTHDESHRKDPQVVGDGEDGLTVSHAPNGVRCAELALHSGPGPKPATHQRAVRARRGAKATEFDCGASSCWIDRQRRSAPVVPTRNVET